MEKMKKLIFMVSIGLVIFNGCSNKSVTSKSINPKVIKTTTAKVVNSSDRKIEKVTHSKVEHKEWGAPTISEAEAGKLFGFSVNSK